MDDAGRKQPDTHGEKGMVMPAGDPGIPLTEENPQDGCENSGDSESLPAEIARISSLSSEMQDCLSSIIRRTKDAADKLEEIRNSVELKRRELKEIYAIEACAASMKALEEEYRIQKEKFAASMENRRRQLAEEEKLRRAEEEEYRESLQRRRQQQQQEYELKMAEERSLFRNRMEEELRKVLQEARDKESAIEEELRKREHALNRREEECGRLIEELELFMKRLAVRRGIDDRGALSSMAPDSGAGDRPGRLRIGGEPRYSSGIGSGDIHPGAGEHPDEDPPVISVRRMLFRRGPLGASRLTPGESGDPHALDSSS